LGWLCHCLVVTNQVNCYLRTLLVVCQGSSRYINLCLVMYPSWKELTSKCILK
jgi:hypothetical protein